MTDLQKYKAEKKEELKEIITQIQTAADALVKLDSDIFYEVAEQDIPIPMSSDLYEVAEALEEKLNA